MRKSETRQPIIVKRAKRKHDTFHGGNWKIAYADFVTAMMAFFLLMWLLSSSSRGDLQGIADYFRTPLRVAISGGTSAGESPSVIRGGAKGLLPPTQELMGGSSPFDRPMPDVNATRYLDRDDRMTLNQLKRKVELLLVDHTMMSQFRDQIRLDVTSEGLRVQIFDKEQRPMFDLGSAVVKDYMRSILRELGPVLNAVDHKITLAGHTDALQYANGNRGYSNWELSADRANASRRELVAGGIDEKKILRVVGVGASVMLNTADPYDPINRRISIVVLNRSTEERVMRDLGTADLTKSR